MTSTVTAGEAMPDIAMETPDGGSVKPSDFAGKKLVIFFYPKDNTPGCTTESIDFSSLKPEFEALGVQIIGVSKDSLKSHANFKTKKDLTVVLASDENNDACEQFGVWVEKNMYGKKYMGIERSTFLVLANGEIAEVWRKVKVKGHAQAVLEASAEILNA